MTEPASTTAGVLLAAGRGRRMGRLKQVLPWGGSTVVASAFDALARRCGAGMVVVVGDDAERVEGALAGRTYEAVFSDSDAEQIASARAGFRRALALPGVERVFLHPADHPVIPPGVLDELLRRADARTALVPTWRGSGGHPVLVPAALAAALLAETSRTPGGLRGYWTAHPQQVRRIEFPDAPELVMDLDSPDDYDAAQRGPA
jgi:CTP:molybdopterin cytidylyltransferase MocA